MTDLRALLAPIRERHVAACDYPGPVTIEESQRDAEGLLAAIEAVGGLHKPEKRWMPYRDADRSYDTAKEASLDMGHTFTNDPSNMPYFEVCAHCKMVEEGPCDGECTKELGYRESLWPCPTMTALAAALGSDTTNQEGTQ